MDKGILGGLGSTRLFNPL